jgi:ribose 5-phosphate isomerase A
VASLERRAVAHRAAQLVPNGARIGLGSGRTVEALVRALGQRVRAGLRVQCVTSARHIDALARSQGLKTVALDDRPLALTLDGADEVDPEGQLLKGGGGALVRERIVATAAKRYVILVDETKLVQRLGHSAKLPVEILQWGAPATHRHIERLLACTAVLRRRGGKTFVSDSGGWILDCPLPARADLRRLADQLRTLPGVIDHGLFLDLEPEVLVGTVER